MRREDARDGLGQGRTRNPLPGPAPAPGPTDVKTWRRSRDPLGRSARREDEQLREEAVPDYGERADQAVAKRQEAYQQQAEQEAYSAAWGLQDAQGLPDQVCKEAAWWAPVRDQMNITVSKSNSTTVLCSKG